MMVIARILATLVDLVLGIAMLVFAVMVIQPALVSLGLETTFSASVVLLLVAAVYGGLQYFFMRSGQTIGKAFFGLVIVSTDKSRPIDVSIIFQREVFLKFFTVYLMCIPVLWNKPGAHEVSTHTKIQWLKYVRKTQEKEDYDV